MRTRLPAIVMAALLVLYMVLVAQLAVRFLSVDESTAKAMGIALFALPLVGLWALVAELVFGIRSERLGRKLAVEGSDSFAEIPRLPSGRVERAAADAAFPLFHAATEAAPDSWASWYRLGLAYDACGDRRRARSAIRHSLALEREARSSSKTAD